MKTRCVLALLCAAALSACTSQPVLPGGTEPVKAEAWQVEAAARNAVSVMEQNGVELRSADVLKGNDWHNYVAAAKTARALLQPSVAGVLDDVDIGKAIVIAKTVISTGHAAFLLANPASITEDEAVQYEIDGQSADAAFDAFVAEHPD